MQMADSCNPILGLASFLGSNSVMDESTMIAPLGFGNSVYERGMLELRYMKAAQQLLDEVVNVSKVSNRLPDESCDENKSEILKEGEEGDPKDDPGPNAKESANRSSKLSDSERVELQDKLSRLNSMLEEVDKRYDQYYNQMQIVKQSFDAMAGSGASKPYTALALRRISHQFRCLRDAITGQIHANRKRLGDGDDAPKTRLSRLRHIDQRLMQRRAAQQLGMMQQESWRPHRGLPESSVSALRAWLFEHFLHPYPKDSDKALLARQTGLTRGQVSNWFINARVRLWKPMVEEIYKEEMGGLEQELDSLYENVAVVSNSEEKCRDLEKAACSEDCPVRELDTDVAEGSADFQEGNHQDAGNTERDTGRVRSAVSVSLGLQHQEGGRLPLPEARHLSMVAEGSDSFYDTPRSSAAAKAIDPGNQQRTVPSSHQLMHDFVA